MKGDRKWPEQIERLLGVLYKPLNKAAQIGGTSTHTLSKEREHPKGIEETTTNEGECVAEEKRSLREECIECDVCQHC